MTSTGTRVYSHESLAMVGHMRNLLAHNGIACEIRNQALGSVIGEIPPVECWPQLWVLQRGDLSRAQELIESEINADDASQPDWTCRKCGASNEGQFAACWQCGVEDSD